MKAGESTEHYACAVLVVWGGRHKSCGWYFGGHIGLSYRPNSKDSRIRNFCVDKQNFCNQNGQRMLYFCDFFSEPIFAEGVAPKTMDWQSNVLN